MKDDKQQKKEYLFIWCVFLASVLFRYFLADFPKTISVYDDELLYTQIAQSILANGKILVHNIPTNFQTVLYSVFISPAYLADNPESVQKWIAFINSVLMSSAIFPAYGVSKIVCRHSCSRLLSIAVIMTMSEFAFTITFMSENIFFPFMMLCLYFMLKSLKEDGSRKVLFTGLSAVATLAVYYGKTVGIYLGAAFGVMLAYQFIRAVVLKEDTWKNIVLCGFLYLFILAGLFYAVKSFLFQNAGSNYDAAVVRTLGGMGEGLVFGFKSYLKIVCFAAVSFFYLPLVYPLFHYKQMDREKRYGYGLSLLSLFIGIAVIVLMITIPEEMGNEFLRMHLRYLFPLFVPFLMITVDMMYDTIKNPHIGDEPGRKARIIIPSAGFLVLIVYNFDMLATGSHVDQTSLKYFQYLLNIRDRINAYFSFQAVQAGMAVLIGAVILCFTICIIKRKSKWLFGTMISLVLIVNLLNTVLATRDYRMEYGRFSEDKDLEQLISLNQFIQNTDENILLLYNNTYSKTRKIFDSYIFQRDNLFYSIPPYVSEVNAEGKYLLKGQGIKIPGTLGIDRYRDVDRIKYMITFGVSVDLENAVKVEDLSGNLFQVYENLNQEVLQLKERSIFPEQAGGIRTIDSNELIFYTNGIWRDGEYISTKKSSLLYGPYCTIKPGVYNVKFYFRHEGQQDGRELGTVQMAIPQNFDTCSSSFYEGAEYAELPNIRVTEENTGVELKMFVNESGISVQRVVIEKTGEIG